MLTGEKLAMKKAFDRLEDASKIAEKSLNESEPSGTKILEFCSGNSHPKCETGQLVQLIKDTNAHRLNLV